MNAPKTLICLECGATFTSQRLAELHTFNPPTKRNPTVYTPRKRHVIFPVSGRGWHTAGPIAPPGIDPAQVAPLRECGTPSTTSVADVVPAVQLLPEQGP